MVDLLNAGLRVALEQVRELRSQLLLGGVATEPVQDVPLTVSSLLPSETTMFLNPAVSAVPLIGFAYGVRRIPLSVVGLLQYVAPSLQLLIGVLVFKEAFDATRAVGFAAIWAGLVIFASDGLWRARRRDALVAASAGK